ncbi:mobilization protein [Brucella anthropi]|uniref:mobilization protein n=1 Tax=Brucella anthropi TaxID=529 RepID=UPI00124DB489|nr:mobilization protein [Brucella anthropi]KAB2730805.1 mobilization protein [Brucella anthropi]
MARKSIEERLAQLDAQRAALKARLGKQERANDTRRKVLLGALVLHRLENSNDPDFTNRLTAWLRKELPGFLTRDGDKELFADLLGKRPDGPDTGSNEETTS